MLGVLFKNSAISKLYYTIFTFITLVGQTNLIYTFKTVSNKCMYLVYNLYTTISKTAKIFM